MEMEFANLIPYVDKLFLRYYTLHAEAISSSLHEPSDDLRRVLPGLGGDCLHAARQAIREFIATGSYSGLGEFSDRLWGVRFNITIKPTNSEGVVDLKISIVDNPRDKRKETMIKRIVKQLKREGFDVNTY